MEEIWKNIQGYEGLYQVSNLGRIKSLNYNHKNIEKILKYGIDTSGYKVVNLWKDGKGKTKTIHRLVAIHFISNPNNYPVINHIDENKQNNNITNLEWCTYKYNINYSSRDGHAISERMKNNNNAIKKKVKCITTGEVFDAVIEAARKYNIDRSSISKACKGKMKYTGKHPITKEELRWEYVE